MEQQEEKPRVTAIAEARRTRFFIGVWVGYFTKGLKKTAAGSHGQSHGSRSNCGADTEEHDSDARNQRIVGNGKSTSGFSPDIRRQASLEPGHFHLQKSPATTWAAGLENPLSFTQW